MSNSTISIGSCRISEKPKLGDLLFDARIMSDCVAEQIRVTLSGLDGISDAADHVVKSLYGTLYLAEMAREMVAKADDLVPYEARNQVS